MSLDVARVKARRDFLAANSGVRVSTPAFLLLVKKTGQGVSRVGFTVSKKNGNAVQRNRAKRRLREVARIAVADSGFESADHIFIARPLPAERSFAQLLEDARYALTMAASRL